MERHAYFLIRKMSPQLRAALEADSQEQPIQETVRSILCAHYGLDCSPINGWAREDARRRSLTIIVRMQPELFSALKEDAKLEEVSMQRLVHEALEAHYSMTEVTPA